MNTPKIGYRSIVSAAAFITLLIAFNLTRRASESAESLAYVQTVSLFEHKAKAAIEDGKSAGAVSIHVLSEADPRLNLSIASDGAPSDAAKIDAILHLLDLVHEAGIFNDRSSSGDVKIRVGVGDQVFEGSFKSSEIPKKAPLGTLLKLLQVHAHA